MVPLFAMIFAISDLCWSFFVEGTLQWAVKSAVHNSVNLSASQMAPGACLTDTVKSMVQQYSLGLLSGPTGRAKIQVHYYQPPDPSTGGNVTDVSTQSTGNTPGNILQVSVPQYPILPLFRLNLFTSQSASTSLGFNAYSADMINSQGAGGNIPCIGTAP
jgi:hypothetical protein